MSLVVKELWFRLSTSGCRPLGAETLLGAGPLPCGRAAMDPASGSSGEENRKEPPAEGGREGGQAGWFCPGPEPPPILSEVAAPTVCSWACSTFVKRSRSVWAGGAELHSNLTALPVGPGWNAHPLVRAEPPPPSEKPPGSRSSTVGFVLL